MRCAAVLAVVVLLGAGCSNKSSGRVVRIAAASDLSRAFAELGREFKTRTGVAPEFTFGASGQLAQQIARGAPYFLFAAANQEFIAQAVASGKCDGTTAKLYGRGRIVVWARKDVRAPVSMEDLADERFHKIALADPAHAPYGLAGKRALQKAGLWERLEPRIVLAADVQATMLDARNGDTDIAIVALSLAVVSDGGAYLAIDPQLHEPLEHQLVVCGNGAEADAARQFAEFVGSREGREIMTRYGFVLPEE